MIKRKPRQCKWNIEKQKEIKRGKLTNVENGERTHRERDSACKFQIIIITREID